ncbi:hypothetical protein CAPTEDRAFT_186289 [Capitella teleta]|uniref:G-protein coupled receptors family 1 profile domain-containing protein n=1 Tax=Capitella teleta TaxID=283909 RepID=R7VFB8_CAPTE|nr:hypothetical protein CAPTEDRAFT_186289 [Capitella teleta]|eukprot:ELU15001.1 hypothetical protein CAPTEDRAFT_186289 [Capitella teleta]
MSSTEAHFDSVSNAEALATEVPPALRHILPDLKEWFVWAMLHVDIVFFFGCTLNIITLLAVWKASILKNCRPVHLFIVNIMCTDLLSTVVCQFWLVFYYTDAGIEYIRGKRWACLVCQVATLISLESTFYGILLMTIERLIAIAFPLQHIHRVTKKSCNRVICLAWLFLIGKNCILFLWHTYDPRRQCIPQAFMYPAFIELSPQPVALRNSHNDRRLECRNFLRRVRIQRNQSWFEVNRSRQEERWSSQRAEDGQDDVLGRFFALPDMVSAEYSCNRWNALGTVADPLLYIWQNPQCRNAVAKLLGLNHKDERNGSRLSVSTVSQRVN